MWSPTQNSAFTPLFPISGNCSIFDVLRENAEYNFTYMVSLNNYFVQFIITTVIQLLVFDHTLTKYTSQSTIYLLWQS